MRKRPLDDSADFDGGVGLFLEILPCGQEIFPSLDMAFSGNRSYDQYFIEEITDSMNDIDRLLLSSKHPSVRFIFYADF